MIAQIGLCLAVVNVGLTTAIGWMLVKSSRKSQAYHFPEGAVRKMLDNSAKHFNAATPPEGDT